MRVLTKLIRIIHSWKNILLSVAPCTFQTANRGSNNYKKISRAETTSGTSFYYFSFSKMSHRFSKDLYVRYTNNPDSLEQPLIKSNVFTRKSVPPAGKVLEKLL